MRGAGDVEKQSMWCIDGDERCEAIAPFGDRCEQFAVGDFIRFGNIECENARTGIGQPGRLGVPALQGCGQADGKWLKVNTEYSKSWPNITVKGTPPNDADAFKDEKGKFEKYFSPEPGTGD